MAKTPAQAFLSYAHADDEFLDGGITWFRRELQRGMRALTGEAFEIFQDKDGIAFGEHWPDRIDDALIGARFLIPILTPSYFASRQCCAEAATFLDLENQAGRQDLILPIYLIEADVLEDAKHRDSNAIARIFYERQYADWRNAAFDLRNSPRIKQRVFDLAKQIKAASERFAKDAPPIVPAQGPGIRFELNQDGKIDRAPDEPPEVRDDDPRLCALQNGLQDACSRFLGSIAGSGDNIYTAYGPLNDIVLDYQAAIAGKLTELQYTDIHLHGVRLQNHMLARSRDVPRLDPPPPLEDKQEAAINDLLTFHANFMLSNRDGAELQAQNEREQTTAEERARLWSPTLSDAAEASDHATSRAKAILANVNQPSEDGAASDRHALFALATNRNFLTATGEAATGKDLCDIGSDATTKAGNTAGRFLLKNAGLIKRLATSPSYHLPWLTQLITWLGGQRAPSSAVRPAVPDAPTVVKNDFWTPGRVFRDIDEPWCPEMVVIPPGEFMMGSPEGEEGRHSNEEPRHLVNVKKPFALGRCPVTSEEFDFFCNEIGRAKPDDEGWGRGLRPVINVSWHDATSYCTWLSEKTERNYRLPTEAEWEYACRAGSQAAYSFGPAIDKSQANFKGSVGKTSKVGTYPANAFGLFEMHGNVRDWCIDHYLPDYAEAPNDGNPLLIVIGAHRVVRGGTWLSAARDVRSASRYRYEPKTRHIDLGFRCARV